MSGSSLAHMSWECPGLHGPGTKQDIRRTSMRQLLTGEDRILIPLFQRKYCWTQSQLSGWWNDIITGDTSYNFVPLLGKSSHSVGNLVMRRSAVDKSTYICLDGQQRLTTTSILTAVMRDAALEEIDKLAASGGQKEKDDEVMLRKLVHDLEQVLFINVATAKNPRSFEDQIKSFRLIPSHVDRASYAKVITGQNLLKLQNQDLKKSQNNESEENIEQESYQEFAASFFKSQLEKTLKEKSPQGSREGRIKNIVSWANRALDRMSPVVIEIMNDVNMSQVFLWFQEKTLFSEGSQLENRSPGVDFRASDLVRNLVMSGYMHLPIEKQEEIYKQFFVDVLEKQFPDPDKMDAFLQKFLEKNNFNFLGMDRLDALEKNPRHVGSFEETVMGFIKSNTSKNMKRGKCYTPNTQTGMALYGRFHSYFDSECISMKCMPAPAVPGEKNTTTDVTEETQINIEFNMKVCHHVLKQLIDYANKLQS